MNIESKKRKPSGKKKLSKSLALRRAQTLLEVSARCAAANDLVGVLHALVDITARTLGCDRGTLFLNDAETGELYSRVAQGDLIREIRIPEHHLRAHTPGLWRNHRCHAVPEQNPRFILR
ncbi:MAG: hypothetical protein EB102_06835 [Gammaproteobacteria bacterium]|nr:hypothetical protein [Gammaproteobacteria bacterium]